MTEPDTLVIIESGLLPFGLDAFRTCRELGLHTLLVTNNLAGYLGSPTAKHGIRSYVDEIVETQTTSAAPVVAALNKHHRRARVCGVFSVTDYSVQVVADVANALGLPGLAPHAARNARNKVETLRRCAAAQVPIPQFAWVTSADETREAATNIGLPCVVKPLSEACSVGVRLCRSPEEAAQHFQTLDAVVTDRRGHERPPGALVQEYLIGYEVSVELVHTGCEHAVVGVTDKVLGPHPHFAELGEVFPSALPRRVRRDCGEFAVRALAATGHDFGGAHVEVKITADGPKLVEVNARMAGAQITRLIHEATGLHLPREVIQAHAGLSPDLTTRRDQAAASRYLTSPTTGVLTAVHGLDLARSVPGVADVQLYQDTGTQVRVARSNTDVLGHLVAVGHTPGEAARRAEAALGQISFEVATSA